MLVETLHTTLLSIIMYAKFLAKFMCIVLIHDHDGFTVKLIRENNDTSRSVTVNNMPFEANHK